MVLITSYLNLPFFIARRYLANQKGTFSFIIRLAVLATALSIAVMLIALAVVTGFESVVKEKLYNFMGHVHVSSFDPVRSNSRTAPPIYLDQQLVADIARIPHVVQVTPFAQRPVILQARGRMEGIALKGVDKNYHFPPGISVEGRTVQYPDSGYSRQVLLSEKTASRLDVRAGDTVQLQFIDAEAVPRLRRVVIAGLYHSGLDEVDKYYAICDIRLLQRLNNWSADSINAYQVDLDNERFADTVSNYIHYKLIKAPLESNTTVENYPNIFDWLHLQALDSSILLIIMAIVSIINMAAVLLILMVDRAPMIGLLKTMGMTFKDTVAVFLNIGGLIGGAGILLGNIIAGLLCFIQLKFKVITLPEETYFMKYAPLKVVWWHVAVTDITALFLFVVCMWLPALYIRTIQPAKVLQFK
ncbi:MAG: ABC transporter permease [Taibaiella sp.]|nr:ABC transporter permease [Taibaiella sp.]